MRQSGQKPGDFPANGTKQSESNQRSPVRYQSARLLCMLFVCFLSIVLEKSAKDRKRTKAQVLKSITRAFYEGKQASRRGFREWW
jgi:hypothetical protein